MNRGQEERERLGEMQRSVDSRTKNASWNVTWVFRAGWSTLLYCYLQLVLSPKGAHAQPRPNGAFLTCFSLQLCQEG